jgi:hypothetical protein
MWVRLKLPGLLWLSATAALAQTGIGPVIHSVPFAHHHPGNPATVLQPAFSCFPWSMAVFPSRTLRGYHFFRTPQYGDACRTGWNLEQPEPSSCVSDPATWRQSVVGDCVFSLMLARFTLGFPNATPKENAARNLGGVTFAGNQNQIESAAPVPTSAGTAIVATASTRSRDVASTSSTEAA